MFDRELAVPFSIRWFVDTMNMNVTTLTDWDDVFDAIVSVVAVDVMKREPSLSSSSTGCFEPLFRSSSTDDTFVAPPIKYCIFKIVWLHLLVRLFLDVARMHTHHQLRGLATHRNLDGTDGVKTSRHTSYCVYSSFDSTLLSGRHLPIDDSLLLNSPLTNLRDKMNANPTIARNQPIYSYTDILVKYI